MTEPMTPRTPADRVPKRKRPHPAQGSRIAAAGVGMVSMFGIVAGLGWAQRSTAAEPPAPAPTVAPAQVIVVVHHTNGTTTVGATSTGATSTGATSTGVTTPGVVPAAAPVAAPIPLVAQPTVRPAPAAQPANGSTHGSR